MSAIPKVFVPLIVRKLPVSPAVKPPYSVAREVEHANDDGLGEDHVIVEQFAVDNNCARAECVALSGHLHHADHVFQVAVLVQATIARPFVDQMQVEYMEEF